MANYVPLDPAWILQDLEPHSLEWEQTVWANYLDDMMHPSTWGDHIVIQALANLLQVCQF
jgi:hypothetical protein